MLSGQVIFLSISANSNRVAFRGWNLAFLLRQKCVQRKQNRDNLLQQIGTLVEKKCNSYKIIAKTFARSCTRKLTLNALTLTNSCKIFARVVLFAKFLQDLCVFCKNLTRVVFSLDESLTQWFVIWLKESYTYIYKFRVFRNHNVNGFLQLIQNPPFRVGWENDRNPKGRDKVILEIKFQCVFLFRQIKPLQTIWFQKIPYPWCF